MKIQGKYKQIVIVAVGLLIALAGIGVFWFINKGVGIGLGEAKWDGNNQTAIINLSREEEILKNYESVPEYNTEANATVAKKTYKNDKYRFSFDMPENFTSGSAVVDEGDLMTFQNAGNGIGFQIYITPYTGTDPNITPERVRGEAGLKVENSLPLQVGSENSGLAFISDNEAFGISREVWFIFGGHLYQISTYLKQDALLQEALGTWKFW